MDEQRSPDRRRYDPAAVTSLVLALSGVAVIASIGLQPITLIWSVIVAVLVASWILVPMRPFWVFVALTFVVASVLLASLLSLYFLPASVALVVAAVRGSLDHSRTNAWCACRRFA